MHNLKRVSLISRQLPSLEQVHHLRTSPNDNLAYGINGQGKIVKVSENGNTRVLKEIPSTVNLNDVVGSGINCDQNSYCFACSDGHIWSYELDANLLIKVTNLGHSLEFMSCNQEGDRFVVITQNQNQQFLLLDSYFQHMKEGYLHTDDQGAVDLLNVGWGKKETQFHGQEGKQSREVKKTVWEVNELDDRKPRVTFRADGAFFAISIVDTNKKCRKIRIYDRDGELQYTAEERGGLGAEISWKPGGNMIAATIDDTKSTKVVFFEKNGLIFQEFDFVKYFPKLNGNESAKVQITQISWSNDASCLLIRGHYNRSNKSDDKSALKEYIWLFTCKNYHWYCKQVLQFNSVSSVLWHPEKHLQFQVLQRNGRLFIYEFIRTVDRYDATVGVIDGQKLLITPFDCSLVPPPMCAYEIEFKEQINECHFNECGLLVKLGANRIYFLRPVASIETVENELFKLKFQAISYKQPNRPNIYAQLEHLDYIAEHDVYHLTFIKDRWLAFVRSPDFDSKNEDYNDEDEDDPDNDEPEDPPYSTLHLYLKKQRMFKLDLPSEIIAIGNDSYDHIVFQTRDKLVHILQLSTLCSSWLPDTELCDRLHVVGRRGVQPIVIQLNETRRNLYLDHRLISKGNCTSFLVHNKRFLLFTTTNHQLCCVDLRNSQAPPSTESILPKRLENEFKRSVERGSQLIASAKVEGRVILQMPRGNLEIISPRILLLDLLMHILDNQAYGEAFKLMKKHRINLNLIVDHDLNAFMDNTDKFVKDLAQLGDQEICLFLSEISDKDVTKTLYSYFYGREPEPELKISEAATPNGTSKSSSPTMAKSMPEDKTTKLYKVCKAVRLALETADSNRFFIPILLTYIKTSKPKMGKVLQLIRQAKTPELRDSALKYLIYIIDVNVLFDEALGTYDLDTALMVAYRSNKDPKEFVPFLNGLKSIEPEAYRQFRIDSHLKRYLSAIRRLCEIDIQPYFDEFMSIVEKQRLYKLAISLLANQEDVRRRIWFKYADYLLNKKYFEEAILAYKRAGDYSMAVKAAQLSGDWNQAIQCATEIYTAEEMIKCEEPAVASLMRTLAENLIANRLYLEAASIYELYLRDVNQAISALIAGNCWDSVFRLVVVHQKPELRIQAVNVMLEQQHQIWVDIHASKSKLAKHCKRLPLARQQKLTNSLTNGVRGRPDGDDFDDSASTLSSYSRGSMDSSVRSSGSKSSNTNSLATKDTSRNSRKSRREMKKYQLREGTQNEDLALINEIKQIILKTDEIKTEVKCLLKHLYDQGHEDEAKFLQTEFASLLQQVEEAIRIVWTDLNGQETNHEFNKMGKITIDDPLLQSPPQLKQVDWKLILIDESS